MKDALIKAEQISVQFGGLWAVKDVNMHVGAGEIVGVIGPNGAGKSTFLNVLTGLQRPSAGHLQIKDQKLVKPQAWQMAKLGISRSFQTIRLLEDLSVIENVMIGSHRFSNRSVIGVLGRTPKWRRTERMLNQQAQEMLKWLGIGELVNEKIGNISLQERRRVEVCRALMTRPDVLLLDEPCAGLSQQESLAFCDVIQAIRSRGISIVLVEHNVKMVMSLSDRIIVLDHGQKIAEGTPEEVSRNQAVIQAYLGGTAHA
ncbi:ABC transporter ATP-binding protein [Paenibacillus beijingensis]|uniref:ABC transporter domain-containing protein n=1 Tax=Paenibacillus beijingensis TaxID=1126833 RepID=A0A0D5NK83_9BACL|nr:ABC transporter ATP-binding protein [Paenibacillus beijingensis]AJY75417.1 hypothetical protein VN24_13605 [Paenibacillus beijingensis]